MATYHFPRRLPKFEKIKPFRPTPVPKDPEDEKGIIHGLKAASKEEWNVAQALWALKLEFFYQFPINGGRTQRGGYVVDFLVRWAPNWIPLEVQSLRWHSMQFASRERIRIAIIERVLHEKVRFVWEENLQTKAEAIPAVRSAIFDPPPSNA